jgi:hypothetical protein
MRGPDGKLHFKLVYPSIPHLFNEWKQTSNPATTAERVVDYEAVNIFWKGEYWSGLAKSSSPTTFIDGSVGSGNWWYAIGSNTPYSGQLPGPNTTVVSQVHLYVLGDFPRVVPRAEVVIESINFHGEVKRTQSDEYVEIVNRGTAAADLSGWRMLSAGMSLGRAQGFEFPAGTTLEAGARLRVYTNQVDPASGGFSFGSKTAIWRDDGDLGMLYDAQGEEVARYSYGDRA